MLDALNKVAIRLVRTASLQEKNMPHRTVIFTKIGHTAGITLSRPRAGNAVILEMAQELQEIGQRINGDNDIYVVTLTGAGDAFCTGLDKGEKEPCHPSVAVAAIDRPVIAAVNGDAFGGGLEIALAADIRLASDKARFGLPQVARGHIPADGGTQRLPRIIGRGKALELLMTADTLNAAEALEIGLVSRVVSPQTLAGEAQKLAETIAAKGPIALRYLKEAITKGMDLTLEQGLRLEADLYFLLHTTADRTEGIRSYLEKRKPEYKGK
jgi:enoyl-CoA hydratase/carnithine racemase